MPFGLCNTTASFDRLMKNISKLIWKICLVYLDDIIIDANAFKEELKNLEAVFSRLRRAGLLMSPKK